MTAAYNGFAVLAIHDLVEVRTNLIAAAFSESDIESAGVGSIGPAAPGR